MGAVKSTPGADVTEPSTGARPRSTRTLAALAGGAVAIVVLLAVVVTLVLRDSGDTDAAAPKGAETSAPATPTSADGVGPLVVLAHQGGSETYPHETLPGLVAAATSGAAAETDVHWTSDGVAVLVHDDKTTPASEAGPENPMVCEGGPYTVSRTAWSVLRDRCRTLPSASKDGKSYPIPTYDETMKAIAAVPGAQVVAEIKAEDQTADQTRQYLAQITENDMVDRTVVSSFFPDALARVKAEAEAQNLSLRYMLLLRSTAGQALPTPEKLGSQGLWAVALRSDLVTAGNVAALHGQKLVALVWTINTEAQWSAARKAGVDVVMTDRPDAYRAWAAKPDPT